MKTLLLAAAIGIAAFFAGMWTEDRLESTTCRALSMFEHPSPAPIAAAHRNNSPDRANCYAAGRLDPANCYAAGSVTIGWAPNASR